MSEMSAIKKLLDQDIHISQEIHNLSEKFAAFPEDSLDRERFLDFSRHLDYTEELLREADPLIRDIVPDSADPDFYAVLQAKRNIENNNDVFHRLRNLFLGRYVRKQRAQDRELDRERLLTYEPPEYEEEQEEPLFSSAQDDLSAEEEEAMAQEAAIAALEEELAKQEEADIKASKRKKEAARQQKLAKEGAAQDAENARLEEVRQQGRRVEAERLGIHVGDDQQLTEAQLRDERARQAAERLHIEEQRESRKRLRNETFEAYSKRMEQSDTYPRSMEYSHNDFNAFGGDPTKQSGIDYTSPYTITPPQPSGGSEDKTVTPEQRQQARPGYSSQEQVTRSPDPASYERPSSAPYVHQSGAPFQHSTTPPYGYEQKADRPPYAQGYEPHTPKSPYHYGVPSSGAGFDAKGPDISPYPIFAPNNYIHPVPPGGDRPAVYPGGASFHQPVSGAQHLYSMASPAPPQGAGPQPINHIPQISIPTPTGMQPIISGSPAGFALAQEMLRQYKENNQPIPTTYRPLETSNLSSNLQYTYTGHSAVPPESQQQYRPTYQASTVQPGPGAPTRSVQSHSQVRSDRPGDTVPSYPHQPRPTYQPSTAQPDAGYPMRPVQSHSQVRPDRPGDTAPSYPHQSHPTYQPSTVQPDAGNPMRPDQSHSQVRSDRPGSTTPSDSQQPPHMPRATMPPIGSQEPFSRNAQTPNVRANIIHAPQSNQPRTGHEPYRSVTTPLDRPVATPSENRVVSQPKNVKLSNWTLYDSVAANSPKSDQASSKISPAVEQQMMMNLQSARMKYRSAPSKDAALQAAKEYRHERDALFKLRSDIRSGRFEVEPSKPLYPVPAPPRKGAEKGSEVMFVSPTPTGVTSRTFSHTQPGTTTSTHVRHDHVPKKEARFTAQNPMRVTPAYDQAILNRYQSAKSNMAQLTKENRNNPGFRVPETVEKEFKTASEAFLGYTRAKAKGTVVIDKSAQRNVPDYKAWQQRQRAADMNFNLGAIVGTTMQGSSQNPNRTTKASVEEINISLVRPDSLLQRKSLRGAYVRNFGYRMENYSRQAWSRFSRKAYHMLQSGDDDGASSIRTFESGRYYIATTAEVIYALSNRKVFDPKSMLKQASKQEYRLFGELSFKTNRELATLVKENGANAKKAQKLLDFRHQSKLEMDLGKSLEKDFGNRNLKGRLHIVEKRINQLDKTHNRKLQKSFSAKGMQKAYDKEAARLSKKLGRKVTFSSKGKSLFNMKPKSIEAEIEYLKAQGKDLKSYIKRLQSKGALLSKEDRTLLGQLIQQHKEINVELSRLIGFQKAAADYKIQRDFLTKTYRSISRNANFLRSGAYMLYGFMIRPMQQSEDIGVHGLVKLGNISTNHYVHVITKNTFKAAYKTSAWVARKTGLEKAAKATASAVNNSAPVTVSKSVIHSQVKHVKTATREAVKTTKAAVSNITPQKIKTAQRSVSAASTALKSRYDTVATGIHNAVFRAKAWAAKTKLGQGVIRFNNVWHNFSEALRTGLNFAKGIAFKAVGAYLLVFLLIGIICGAGAVLFGGSSSSLVLAPGATADGLVDLVPYVDIIHDAKTDLNETFQSMGSKYDDYRVDYISNYDNTKEMLCMMAVYLSQDIEIDKNPDVKVYLKSLFNDSHPYSTTVEKYKCEGCKTKTINEGHDSDCPEDCTKSHKKKKKYCPGHERLIITVSVLGFDEIFDADTMGNSGHTASQGDKLGDFTITYYCTEKYPHICNAGPPYKTKMGTDPKEGRTIAADTSMPGLSLGSHVIIDGHEYVVEDIGGGVNGYHIDMVVEGSHQTALDRGKRTNVPVYKATYEGASMEESGEWNGWTDDNRQWAKNIYSTNWTEIYAGISDYDGYIETGDLIVEGDYTWPVTATTNSSGYGWRIHPITGVRTFHKGTDIPVPTGTPVHAAADGTVTTARYDTAAGNFVVINHGGGIVTRYLHNSELKVSAGDKVKAGDLIAISGSTGRSTGPHLHFEFIVNGTPIDPRKQYGLD